MNRIVNRLQRAVQPQQQIDPADYEGMERVFLAPPLTTELAQAIHLISPHCGLGTSEQNRLLWEADQNATCWNEYAALAPLLTQLPSPKKVLEIGCGLGRSLVFFRKKLPWQGAEFHAYEGEGKKTRYTMGGPRFEDSFCGNLAMLRDVLSYNGISDVRVFDAAQVRLGELPAPYDFLYSFYGIGFHWSLEHFLDDVLRLMHEHSVAVFTVTPEFMPFAALERMSHQVIEFDTIWPHGDKLRLLVIRKQS